MAQVNRDDQSQKGGFMSKVKGTAHNLKEKIFHKSSGSDQQQGGATSMTTSSSTSSGDQMSGSLASSVYPNPSAAPTLSQDTSNPGGWKPLGMPQEPPSVRSIVENQPASGFSDGLPQAQQTGRQEVLGKDFDLPTMNVDEISGKDEKTVADANMPSGATFSGAGLANPVSVHGSVSPVAVGVATEGSSELVGVTPPSEPALEPHVKELVVEAPVVEQAADMDVGTLGNPGLSATSAQPAVETRIEELTLETPETEQSSDLAAESDMTSETNQSSGTYVGAAQERLGGAYQGAKDYTNQTYNIASDKTSAAYDTAVDKTNQLYGSAADTAGQTYNVAADKTSQVYNAAADTASQVYNVATDKASQAYGTVADSANQAYNVAADKTSQAYNVAADNAGQAYDVAADTATQAYNVTADKANQAYNVAADNAAQTYQGAKEYTAQTIEVAKPKIADAAQTTKETAQNVAAGTVVGAAGVIQGVQEYAGVTDHEAGETPRDAAGQEVTKNDTAEAARSTTVSLLASAGATLVSAGAAAGSVIAAGAQYAKEAIVKSPNTAGYSSNDTTGDSITPSGNTEQGGQTTGGDIAPSSTSKDEVDVAGGADVGKINTTHKGGVAFDLGKPSTFETQGQGIGMQTHGALGQGMEANHHDISTAVPVTGDVAEELQSRMDATAAHDVPKDEAGVAAGAGIGEVVSHIDTLSTEQTPYSGMGTGQVITQGDTLGAEQQVDTTPASKGVTGYVASFFGSKPAE